MNTTTQIATNGYCARRCLKNEASNGFDVKRIKKKYLAYFLFKGGVGVASVGSFLYAVGGYELPSTLMNCNRFDCAERYDPKTDQWTFIARLNRSKEAIGVQSLGQFLYAIGGFDGNRYLDDVEKYDPTKNEWTKVNIFNKENRMCL